MGEVHLTPTGECSQHNRDGTIGVLGVRREIVPFLKRMDVSMTEQAGLARFHEGTLGERRVVAVELGIGKVNAAAATQSLIDRYRPCCAVFTGTAGALWPEISIGDLIIASSVAVHDVGVHRGTGFTPTGFMTLNDKGDHTYAHKVYADSGLVALAHRAAEQLDWPPSPGGRAVQVHVGTVVTGDQIILSQEKKNWLCEAFGALATEMEGAAFAQVASANALPWLLIRSVSDHADHQSDFLFELWQEYVDDPQSVKARIGRALQRLTYMVREPQATLRAKHLLDNLDYAAANAARLTEAIVKAL